jgi:hypothetical protein
LVGWIRRRIKVRLWMLEFAQNWPAFDMVKHIVILVGLVWEPAVIQEDVL